MRTEENDLNVLADTIRDQFRIEKSKQLQRPYKGHPSHDNPEQWEKAALVCQELQADPVDFVKAAFDHCSVRGGPYPKHMGATCSKKWYDINREIWLQDDSNATNMRAAAVEQQIKYILMCCRSANSRDNVEMFEHLEDPICNFPAWAKIILGGHLLRFQHLYLKQAQEELINDPAILIGLRDLNYDVGIFKIGK
jgi:hypothetical protein